MSKIDSYLKQEVSRLSKKDLEKLVLKAASSNKTFYDYLLVNYGDKTNGEKELFEQAKQDLERLFRKSYKGFSDELRLANMLAACNKRINLFAKTCKDKSLILDLVMLTLEIPFSIVPNNFETCFTRFNQQVFYMVKEALTLLKNRLHEDYRIQYAPRLNEYLEILHRTSGHLDYIHTLPKTV